MRPLTRLHYPVELCACRYECATEFTKLLAAASGWDVIGFPTDSGDVKGACIINALAPDCYALFHTQNQYFWINGKRNPDWCVFAVAHSCNELNELKFRHNQSIANHRLLGGFQLSEPLTHYRVNPNTIGMCLIIKRSTVDYYLAAPEALPLKQHMDAFNAVQLSPAGYQWLSSYLWFASLAPQQLRGTRHPIVPLLQHMSDGIYPPANKVVLPSTEVMLSGIHKVRSLALAGGNVNELCAEMGLKRTQLNEACREAWDLTPKELLSRIRVEQAAFLFKHPDERLRLSLYSIEDVSELLKYTRPSVMRSHVKSWFGKTPSQIWSDTNSMQLAMLI